MAKLLRMIALLIWICVLTSCGEDVVYSCDETTDQWVKDNLSSIQKMTRSEWLDISDRGQAQAVFRAFTSEQKSTFWLEKLEKVLTQNWSNEDRAHIENLVDFIKTYHVFDSDLSDDIEEKIDGFLYLWIDRAQNELMWSDETIYSMVCSGLDMEDANLDRSESTQKRVPVGGAGSVSDCSCSTKSDWCASQYERTPIGTIGGGPIQVPVCETGGCTYKLTGCGTLLRYECNGNCQLKNV